MASSSCNDASSPQCNAPCLQGRGLAYGTKEGRLRILTHISRPLLSSKKMEGKGWFEDELLAASQESNSHTSEEEA